MNFAQANTTLQKESNLLWKLWVNTSHHTCAVLESILNSMQLCMRRTLRPDSANCFPFTPPDFPVYLWLIQHKPLTQRLFLPTRPPRWFVFFFSQSVVSIHPSSFVCWELCWLGVRNWMWPHSSLSISRTMLNHTVKPGAKAKSVHTAALWGKRSVPVDFQ